MLINLTVSEFSLVVIGPIVTKFKATEVLRLSRFMVTVTLTCNPREKCIEFELQATVNKQIYNQSLTNSLMTHMSCTVLRISKSFGVLQPITERFCVN